MGWQWKQEDFAEQSRFMTGRSRRLAERDMRRATISHNLEGDSIERGRARQEELWKLEDERLELQKTQYEEQLQLQKENLSGQRAFFEERKRLELELTELQREMWRENFALQVESLKVQQKLQAETMKAQMMQQALAAYTLQLSLVQREAIENYGKATIDWTVAAGNSILAMLGRVIEFTNLWGTNTSGSSGSGGGGSSGPRPEMMAYGGGVSAGQLVRVNDTPYSMNQEYFKPHVSGEVIPLFQARDMAKIDGMGSSGSSFQPVQVTINVGGQFLKTVIIDTVKAEIDL
jgi:hypothetical protein